MIPKNLNIAGFSISRTTGLIIIGVVLFIGFKTFSLIGSYFDSLMIKLGIKKPTDGSDMNDYEKNKDFIQKEMLKDPAVQSQMTVGNRQKAENIHRLINTLWVNPDDLLVILKTVTGPNQRAAIWQMYGERSLISRFGFKGDLYENIKYVLMPWQWSKVKAHMDLFLKTK